MVGAGGWFDAWVLVCRCVMRYLASRDLKTLARGVGAAPGSVKSVSRIQLFPHFLQEGK